MNSSDNRVLVLLLCVALVGGLLYMGYNLFLLPLQQCDNEIARLRADNQTKTLQILKIVRDRKRLQQWRVLSLPGAENLPKGKGLPPQNDRDSALLEAQHRYSAYLRNLLKKYNLNSNQTPHGLSVDLKNIPTVGLNVPVYTPLRFSLEARGRYDNMIKMVDEFQKTPLLQRIRSLTIKQGQAKSRKGPRESLVMTLVVEALVVNGARKRGENLFAVTQPFVALDAALIALHCRPSGASVLPWHKIYAAAVSPAHTYAELARKNIFDGKPPAVIKKIAKRRPSPNMLTTTFLTDVTVSATGAREANLFNRLTDQVIQLQSLPGGNGMPLLKSSSGGTVIRGEAVRIDTSGVVFRVLLVARSHDEEPEHLRYKKTDAIYRLYGPDADALVKAGVIRSEEIARTYKVPVPYWETLLDEETLKLAPGGRFAFRFELVRGRILKRDDRLVLIKLDDRYCSYTDEKTKRVQPHLGYCLMLLGERLSTALQTPLPENEVRELQQAVAQAP